MVRQKQAARLGAACFVFSMAVLLVIKVQAAGRSPNVPTKRAASIAATHEQDCIQKGWQKLTVLVDGVPQQLIWKGPPGPWEHGAIVVFHGGGGMATNYCSSLPVGQALVDYGIRLGRPMVDFAELALEEGFAVFSPDSGRGTLTDAQGNSCGKRWNCLVQAHEKSSNRDLAFIQVLLQQTIPALRPPGSAADIFAAGVSNGGFMTILTATQFPDDITAFAPVSAGDPYGTHMDCSPGPISIRKSAPGTFLDNETLRSIAKSHSCEAAAYLHEQSWPAALGTRKPPFKLFYHEGDGGVDTSCKEKVEKLLVERRYPDDGSFIIKHRGKRTIQNHFWMQSYNRPILAFFMRSARVTPGQ